VEEKKRMGRPPTGKPHKKQYPLKLTEEMTAELQAAAYWSRRTANSILEDGLEIMLEKLQKEHNDGKPFPPKPKDA
jgi:hypothetical protein